MDPTNPHAAHELQDGADPLAAALLPVLIHRLNNATQYMTGLTAVLGTVPAGDRHAVLAGRSDGLGESAEELDELGWLLAVTACASGADLLGERRRRGGLASVVALVGEALRRVGRGLEEPESDLARVCLDPTVGSGWELPWACGTLLWTAGCSRSAPDLDTGRLAWRLEIDEHASVLRARTGLEPDEMEACAAALRGLEGATLDADADEVRMVFPAGWLSDSKHTEDDA